jgi:hypothetical protein
MITSRGTHYRVGPMYVKVGGTHTCLGGPMWDPPIVKVGSIGPTRSSGTYTCLENPVGTHY